jgi:hypothetical protein
MRSFKEKTPRWETPEQYQARTGVAWRDSWMVWAEVSDDDWEVMEYWKARKRGEELSEYSGEPVSLVLVCCPPPHEDWEEESGGNKKEGHRVLRHDDLEPMAHGLIKLD